MAEKPAGAILEATIDDGLNWYTVTGISSTPFTLTADNENNNPNARGWAGNINFDNDKLSRYNLKNYSGESAVRFRINFTSSANPVASRYGGIGIDSVWIGNRTKRLVLEHFTNTNTLIRTIKGDNAVNLIREKRKNDISALYYHCSFPQYDLYNQFNIAAPSSRVLEYGVSNTPRTVLDGNAYNGDTYDGINISEKLDTNDVDARLLETARFKMDMSTYFSNNQITSAVKIIYTDQIVPYSSSLILHVVIVEDTAGGNIKYSSVVREMLPDASGRDIGKTWQVNDSHNVTSVWNYGNLNANRLGVVAFIQNLHTREILQSVYIKGQGHSGSIVIASNEESESSVSEILVYPNPADEEIKVVVVSGKLYIINWMLTDAIGKSVFSESFKSNKEILIQTSELAIGIYYLKGKLSDGSIFLKKIIIKH